MQGLGIRKARPGQHRDDRGRRGTGPPPFPHTMLLGGMKGLSGYGHGQ